MKIENISVSFYIRGKGRFELPIKKFNKILTGKYIEIKNESYISTEYEIKFKLNFFSLTKTFWIEEVDIIFKEMYYEIFDCRENL